MARQVRQARKIVLLLVALASVLLALGMLFIKTGPMELASASTLELSGWLGLMVLPVATLWTLRLDSVQRRRRA